MKKQKAIIVGGGIGGLTLATAFEKIGLDYIVLEQASEIKEVGAGVTIWSNGLNCLKELDLEHSFKEKSYHTNSFFIHNHQGKILTHICLSDFEKQFGSVASIIHRANLIDILLKSIPSEKILLNKKVKSFFQDSENIFVTLTSGEKIKGNLLIGADGTHSIIRKHIGDSRKLKYAGYTCWRGVLKADHHIYVPKSGMVVITGPKSLFGLTLYSVDKLYWFAQRTQPEEMTNDLQLNNLKQSFYKWPKYVQEIINNTSPKSIIRNDILYLTPRKIWGKGLCTLLGDAAHLTTPDMAQGACMALEDAIELAHCLLKTSNTEKALRLYERKRYRRTQKLVEDSRLIGRVFQIENPFLIKIRDSSYFFKIGSTSIGSLMFRSIFRRYAKYRPPSLAK